MVNNDRKQSTKFVAPRWGAISYALFLLSLLTSYGGTPQKSTENRFFTFIWYGEWNIKKIEFYTVYRKKCYKNWILYDI